LFAEHDLVFLPYLLDGAGLAAVTSLTMGTPCVAFAIAPISEYVKDKVNAMLLPTVFKADKLNLPVASPDFGMASAKLKNLVREPHRIFKLTDNTNVDLWNLEEKFVINWGKLIDEVVRK